MTDEQRFLNKDLVLTVSPSLDPAKYDPSMYEPFLDALCGPRDYQKSAIQSALRYLLGGRYGTLRTLAEENYKTNNHLKQRYGSFKEMEKFLQFPDALSCSLDLATGTGKSYVMYAIARIMLAAGTVDRVLVLCPSKTIEQGLVMKFKELSADSILRDVLPPDSAVLTPHVIDASQSITEGAICVENYHAVLGHVRSSVRDSLQGKGDRTLVLNDEVHHVYNGIDKHSKKWKDFLIDPAFNFKYLVGFSGTCYVDDEYFNDVISRYGLAEAIETGFVKTIDYVAEDSSGSQDEKLQKMYDNHLENKSRYRKVKPLTVLITKDIAECKRLTEELTAFLAKQEMVSKDDAARKVLIVTSAEEHERNVRALTAVDSSESTVEWIVSVTMLTEGWDVKNVFQVVPHEKRAFSSKLLIAQVLGRGLRVPDEYRGERPVVTVFNHDNWSSSIKHLVDEVLEIEKRLWSYPVRKDPDYNFTIDQIRYERLIDVEEFKQEKEYEFSRGYFSLASQERALERQTEYVRAHTQERRIKKTLVRYDMTPAADVAEDIHNRLKSIDDETGDTNYAQRYNHDWLLALIRASLRRIGETLDLVSAENKQRLYGAFGVIHRAYAKVPRLRLSPQAPLTVRTQSRRRSSVGFAALRRAECTVFWDEQSAPLSDDETRSHLEDLSKDSILERLAVKIDNTFHFKTPLNIAIADHEPEYRFVRSLIEHAKHVDAWLKSTDQEFYEIEFSWRKGNHPKRGRFSPDFFIKKGNNILVVEIKGNEEIGDPSPENRAKWKAAKAHFECLNDLQEERRYAFNFLTPKDYDLYFAKVKQFAGDSEFSFGSTLDAVLSTNESD